MAVSSEGNYCSVLWPEQSEYAIYGTDSIDSTASWRELARGNAASVAWAANSPTLAVLHVPKVGLRLGLKQKTLLCQVGTFCCTNEEAFQVNGPCSYGVVVEEAVSSKVVLSPLHLKFGFGLRKVEFSTIAVWTVQSSAPAQIRRSRRRSKAREEEAAAAAAQAAAAAVAAAGSAVQVA